MLERLTEKDREFIKNQVSTGYYASEIEVVRDAIRRLREKVQSEKLEHLRELARVGHEEMLRGEFEILDENTMDKIMQEALKHYEEKRPIKDEVKP